MSPQLDIPTFVYAFIATFSPCARIIRWKQIILVIFSFVIDYYRTPKNLSLAVISTFYVLASVIFKRKNARRSRERVVYCPL